MLQAVLNPFQESEISPVCGDWGTVLAGDRPGVLVEEMLRPSVPVYELLAHLGGGEWVSPDILACHLVWGEVLFCAWEIKLRTSTGDLHTDNLGTIFRDGSCLRCRFSQPFGGGWQSFIDMLEHLLPHTDYLRITAFVRDGGPVLNEIEYTTGGLEVIPLALVREWLPRWLEGYYRLNS